MGAPFYDGNVTYTWTSSDGQDHMLSLAFVNNDVEIDVHTECTFRRRPSTRAEASS